MVLERVLEAIKAELKIMRDEKKCMEVLLVAAGTEIEEMKRLLAVCKAMQNLADYSLNLAIEALGLNNVDPADGEMINLDEETFKGLLEEAARNFIEEEMNELVRSRESSPVNEGHRNAGGGSNGGEGVGGRPEKN